MCYLVQGVKDTIGTGPFNINELLAVLRLLRYVCSHRDAELARLVKRAHARSQIMVPDSGCCLVPTSACAHAHTCPPQLLARYRTLFAMQVHYKQLKLAGGHHPQSACYRATSEAGLLE